MKQFIRFAGFLLVFLMLGTSLSAHSSSKHSRRGPRGPAGPIGPSFVTTFGTWYIPSNGEILINDGDIVPFNTQEVSNGITNASGVFTFSRNGVYQVILGYAPQGSGELLDIELNNILVLGGRIESPVNTPGVITVMFTASAGDKLDVKNKSGLPIMIGPPSPTSISPGIYISILQIR